MSLASYKAQEFQLALHLEQLSQIADQLGESPLALECQQSRERLLSGQFRIAILGEFKRGKSTLLNALIGEAILPSDPLPTTAVINRLRYGLRPSVQLVFADGPAQSISLEELESYTTQLAEGWEEKTAQLVEAQVEYPCEYCRNGVEILDTPGLQDQGRMSKVTLSCLDQLDAAIFVTSALSPISESELHLLSTLSQLPLAKLFIAVTSIDLIPNAFQADWENTQNRLLELLHRRIFGVLQKDSEWRPSTFLLSPYLALQSRANHNPQERIRSGMDAFEEALLDFLAHQRGGSILRLCARKVQEVAAKLLELLIVETNRLSERQRTAKRRLWEAERHQVVGPGPTPNCLNSLQGPTVSPSERRWIWEDHLMTIWEQLSAEASAWWAGLSSSPHPLATQREEAMREVTPTLLQASSQDRWAELERTVRQLWGSRWTEFCRQWEFISQDSALERTTTAHREVAAAESKLTACAKMRNQLEQITASLSGLDPRTKSSFADPDR